MIQVRAMTEADIPLGMRLKTQAGWNQTEADWQRFLHLQPDGCFVARWDGQDVGTTTTCIFGPVGWIAMVLVDSDYRHRGIGTRLVERALQFLKDRNVPAARLDATAQGRPVYERLGFVAEYELMRMEGVVSSVARDASCCQPAGSEHLAEILNRDRQAVGAPREKLLARLLAEPTSRAYLAGDGEEAGGYVLSRDGARAAQIGPTVACSPAAGRALLNRAAVDWTGRRIYVDVPRGNRDAVQWTEDRGLTCQRSFTRMVRGNSVPDNPQRLWASSGPEKG